jgi:alkylated DNA repair dioxygenase AlkB
MLSKVRDGMAQLQFFDEAEQVLAGGVVYQPNFLERAEADELLKAFLRLNWQQHVEGAAHCIFDSLNFNLYRNERDSMGWHSDSEAEGLWDFPIASVSFGAERRFKWQKKNGETTTQTLGHGSLLIMPAWFQRDYVHSVPKQTQPCGARVNLTFRQMGRAAAKVKK